MRRAAKQRLLHFVEYFSVISRIMNELSEADVFDSGKRKAVNQASVSAANQTKWNQKENSKRMKRKHQAINLVALNGMNKSHQVN